jgi:hypothetical protein
VSKISCIKNKKIGRGRGRMREKSNKINKFKMGEERESVEEENKNK